MRAVEIKNGIFMLVGFIIFFLVMKFLGLYENMALRFLNFIIHGTFVYLSVKAYHETKKGHEYLPTFMAGMRTTVIGVFGFVIFQYFYLALIDPEFMAYISENAIMGNRLTPVTTCIFLMVEGIAGGILFSYVSMRYVGAKDTRHAGL